MVSVVDERQQAVEPIHEEPTPEHLDRAVDLIIVRLRAAGYSSKDIGFILNRKPQTIFNRFNNIPGKVRDYYAKLA